MTFSCSFGKGVVCTAEAPDEPPLKGSPDIHRVEWTGRPSPKVLRPYIAWMNSVNQVLANTWDMKLMHVYMLSKGRTETWTYEPGKGPQRETGGRPSEIVSLPKK